jgi:hypothetical protein
MNKPLTSAVAALATVLCLLAVPGSVLSADEHLLGLGRAPTQIEVRNALAAIEKSIFQSYQKALATTVRITCDEGNNQHSEALCHYKLRLIYLAQSTGKNVPIPVSRIWERDV